jgi:hypothetical protein
MAEDRDLRALTSRTARDNLQVKLTATLSAIPMVGGPLSVLVTEYIPLSRAERLHDFVGKLAADIEALGARVDADFIRTDSFAELFETALADALRSSEDEKRAAYAAILANALTDARPDDEESLLFTDLLRQCRSLHIRTLSNLRNAPEVRDEDHYGFSMGSVFTTMKEVFPPFDEQLFRLAWGTYLAGVSSP